MPNSSLYLAKRLTSTTIALLLLTGFIAMVVPVPIVNNNNAAAELFPSQTTESLTNVLAKTDALQPAVLPFVQNDGQVHPDVRFFVDTFAGRVYVTNNGLTYDLLTGQSNTRMATTESFIHANSPQPFGIERNEAMVNYFVGEKSNWRSDIATFDKVSFGEVWNGITVDLKAVNNNVEKIFTLAPGADVHDIQIKVEGVDELRVDKSGQLVYETELGPLSLTAPVAYQEVDGKVQAAQVSYLIVNSAQYGFSLGIDYNPNYPLVIDPLLASTFIGGSAEDGRGFITTDNPLAGDLAIDSSGDVFLSGATFSSNYPTTAGVYDQTDPSAYNNVVVSKFNSNLSTLLASTFLGGGAYDEAYAISIDPGNNVFIVGKTNSSDFPTTAAGYDETYNGGFDIFVSKLSNNLATLAGSTYIGGSGLDDASDATIDPSIGSDFGIYLTGWTDSTDYPTAGGFQGDTGGRDVIVSKLSNDLSSLVASTYIGGGTIDEAHAIAMNGTATGVLVTGRTTSANYPTTPGAYDTSSNGGSTDTFVSLLNPDLGALIASTYLGGSGSDPANGIVAASAPSYDVYVTGRTDSANFPALGGSGYDTSHNGDFDVFVSRLAPHLNTLVSSTYIGSSNSDSGNAITIGPSGSIYVAVSAGIGYPTTSGAYDETHNGNNEAAISALSSDLASLSASTFVGGLEVEVPIDLARNTAGDIYMSGITNSANFPTTAGAYDTSYNGDFDLFVSKLTADLAAAAPTNLVLDPIRDVTATTGFTVSGTLSNANTGEPATGELITFTGSGVTPSLQAVTTDGVDFIGDINLVSCPTPANPSPGDCVPDELSTLDSDGTNNIVLHLGVGGKISFPEGTMGAKLWIQDMGATSFKYVVEEGNNVFQPEAESGGSLAVIPIVQIITGYSTVGADFVPNGLKEITITEVGGSTNSGSVGIAALLTTNPDGLPAEQHQINFEEFTVGAKNSPFAVNAGHFFTVGFAQNTESNGPLDVTAHFAGTSAFAADDSNTEEYNVLFNTQGTQGEGAAPADNVLGGSITIATCQVDADNDGVCKTWEETGVIPGSDIPGASSAVSFALPPGDGVRSDDDNRKDIYVEIDCMAQASSGNYCPTQTELNAVITAFSRENIRVTMSITGADVNIPYNDPFHIWSANDGDADLTNDFENIKKDFFGTSTERSQGAAGTLRSGKDLLEIKSQIYHYGLFVKNINTGNNVVCGPSGQAELRGNDFIVSLGCGFTGAKGSTYEIQGTLMHELGHNLGLTHGGLDDDNCKPNHISVMSYSRQLPWAQLAATNSGTTVNWVLTYSREDLDNLNGPLDERAVKESDGLAVTAGQWSVTLPSGYQFKLIWGQPPNIRTGVTGTSVNWDNDGSPAETTAYSQDLNKINGMLGCNPGSTVLSPFQSYDEFANLDLTFRTGAGMDGLVYPDPDTISELTPAVLEGVASSSLTLEPIADVSAGGQITATGILTDLSGDPLANEIITFSGSGAENLPSATTDIDGRYTSSGNSPATVATDWEVEAHFEGTANNGPSNSNVETYDTLSEDTNPPTVTTTVPADDSTDVAINVIVNAEFSEAMNEATITDTTFTLAGPGGPVGGTVTYNTGDNTASFDPSSDLASGTTYTATISGTVEDTAGNSMETDYSWDFTTESSALTITGFYAPVDMEDSNGNPIVNTIKSGRAVALKFEVFDSNNVEQTNTSIVQSFKAQKINCGTLQGEPVDPVEVTNAGGTGLRYDETSGFFVQNWKTPSGQAGSCYAVTLTTIDGSSITAYFRLLN